VIVGMVWAMVVEKVVVVWGVELVLGRVVGIGDDAVLVSARDG